jgi:hypothetical protein
MDGIKRIGLVASMCCVAFMPLAFIIFIIARGFLGISP